jgi:hypothetical protein
LPKTYNGNKYISVAIDHHDVEIIARFLENEVICRFGIPKYIMTNNGFEWAA